jgi:hypothetical protein
VYAVANLSDESCRFLMIVTRPASRTSSAPNGTTTLPRCRLVRLRILPRSAQILAGQSDGDEFRSDSQSVSPPINRTREE